jgi:hypothetical protein
MANFAVIDGNNVLNTILADSKVIAEEITGKTCIEFFDSNPAEPGGTYNATTKKFVQKQPYPSWTLDNNNIWKPPVPCPENGKDYFWNEGTTSWTEVVPA